MNSKLHAKFLTMAAATLGLSLAGTGCGNKSEPAAQEGTEAASGAEHSCGSGSCGSAGPAEEGADHGAAGDMAAPAGEAEMGAPAGEMPAEGEPVAPAGEEAEGM